MYKLLALDMDDTLLRKDLTISDRNKSYIKMAFEKGIKIIFCSGRSSKSMLSYMTNFKDYGGHEFFISYNGAMVTDVSNNKKLFYYPVEHKSVNQLIDFARKHNINIQLYKDDFFYVEKVNDKTRRYEQLSGLKAKYVDDLKDISIDGSIKVLFNHENKALLELLPEVNKLFGEQLNIFISKPNYLEFLNLKANKGIALHHLSRHLNIHQDEIIAIGDSYNDLSMIEFAGLGVAMSNGYEDVKLRADYVTEYDHDHDGVAEVIEKFILNN